MPTVVHINPLLSRRHPGHNLNRPVRIALAAAVPSALAIVAVVRRKFVTSSLRGTTILLAWQTSTTKEVPYATEAQPHPLANRLLRAVAQRRTLRPRTGQSLQRRVACHPRRTPDRRGRLLGHAPRGGLPARLRAGTAGWLSPGPGTAGRGTVRRTAKRASGRRHRRPLVGHLRLRRQARNRADRPGHARPHGPQARPHRQHGRTRRATRTLPGPDGQEQGFVE
jgi:hypothetical protein